MSLMELASRDDATYGVEQNVCTEHTLKHVYLEVKIRIHVGDLKEGELRQDDYLSTGTSTQNELVPECCQKVPP